MAGSFLALWRTRPAERDRRWRPIVVVNGASEEGGAPILTSPVRLVGDDDDDKSVAADAADAYTLDPVDIAASTAIHNGARFPWISPAGRLKRDPGRQDILDGGYFDGSGVFTAMDLLSYLPYLAAKHRYKIAPVLITISYKASQPPKASRSWPLAFNDVLAPILGSAAARQALQGHFDLPDARIYVPSGALAAGRGGEVAEARLIHPFQVVLTGMSCEGLPLNWTLSRKAQDYTRSLGSSNKVNDATLQTISQLADVVSGRSAPPSKPVIDRNMHFVC